MIVMAMLKIRATVLGGCVVIAVGEKHGDGMQEESPHHDIPRRIIDTPKSRTLGMHDFICLVSFS
jgi:hypothetical protein